MFLYNKVGDEMKKIQICLISLGIFIAFLLGFGANVLLFNDDSTEIYANEDVETIVIDAGHGGYDAGCIAWDGTQEKDITLDIALSTGKLLKEAGYNVVYTRMSDNVSWSEDNKEDLQSRIDIAESADADYYISIHINSSDYNDGASGYETYVDFNNNEMVEMAESIHSQLELLNYTQDRGLMDTNENLLYVVNNNSVPALLLEVGFITDASDFDYMVNNSDDLAQAIADGIMDSIETEEISEEV